MEAKRIRKDVSAWFSSLDSLEKIYALGLLTGWPVLAVSSHATFKTTTARRLADTITKETWLFSFKGGSSQEMYHKLRELEKIPLFKGISLNKNPYFDVDYKGMTVEVEADYIIVNLDKTREMLEGEGFKFEDTYFRAAELLSFDLTQVDSLSLVFGRLDYIPPPGVPYYVLKSGLKADIIVINEILKGYKAFEQGNSILNPVEKSVSIEGEQVPIKAPLIIATANPPNEVYQTNVDVNEASFNDRFGFSVTPSTTAVGISEMVNRWAGESLSRYLSSLSLEERRKDGKGGIRLRDLLAFKLMAEKLLSSKPLVVSATSRAIIELLALQGSKCAFDLDSDRKKPGVDKFFGVVDKLETSHDCNSCVWSAYKCSKFALREPRVVDSTLRAVTVLKMLGYPEDEALKIAIQHAFPHRMIPWKGDVELYGKPVNAVIPQMKKRIMSYYEEAVALFSKDNSESEDNSEIIGRRPLSTFASLYKSLVESLITGNINEAAEVIDRLIELAEENDDYLIKVAAGHAMKYSEEAGLLSLTEEDDGDNSGSGGNQGEETEGDE